MALTSVDFADLQFAALAEGALTMPDGDVEESQDAIDLSATLARAQRHEVEVRKIHPAAPAQYEVWLRGKIREAGYSYHSVNEIVSLMKRVHRSGAKNKLTPVSLVPRLLIAVELWDIERDGWGSALRRTSAYRAPRYNRAIGGATFSQHAAMAAWDTVPVNGKVREFQRYQERMEGRRFSIRAHLLRLINGIIEDNGLGLPFTTSVVGERINGRALRLDLSPPGGITLRGGQGDYNTFSHRDLRGSASRW